MTCWIRQHWTNEYRTYHTDKTCFALTRAKGKPREATKSQVEAFKLCKWCEGTVDHSENGTNLHQQLSEMDPDDLTADAVGGQS